MTSSENNLALQESLYKLRGETQAAFDDAKSLEKRWKELEKEQKEVYQACPPCFRYIDPPLPKLIHFSSAVYSPIPFDAVEACYDCSG